MFFSLGFFIRLFLVSGMMLLSGCDNPVENNASTPPLKVHWIACDFPVPADSTPLAGTIECGYIIVPENRAAPDGRTINFHFADARRFEENPENNALFTLRGGPGLAGTQIVHGFSNQFKAVRVTHDFVFVDYRGTGKSNPLSCVLEGDLYTVQPYLIHFTDSKLYQHCRGQIPKDVDLDQYNTNNIVDDINSLRAALGYTKIDLFGNSYGTRVAQVFVRRHSNYVRTTILEAPEDITSPLGSSIATDSEKSLRSIIEECKKDVACTNAYPHFEQDFEAFLETLRQGPLLAEVKNPATGEMELASFGYDVAAGQLRNLLYDTQSAATLPYQVDMVTQGEFGPFLDGIVGFYRRIYGTPDSAPFLYVGLYASITCSEDNPFVDLKTVLPQAEGTIMGADRLRDNRKACEIWGINPAGPSFLKPIISDIPTLILVGALDSITPPQNAYNIEGNLSDAVVLVFDSQGHDINVLCALDTKIAFIKAGTTVSVDRDCGKGIERPPFFIRSLESE